MLYVYPNRLPIYLHDGHRIVIKNSRHILRWEFVGGVADQEASFTHRTVTNNDASVNIPSAFVLVHATAVQSRAP